MEGLEVILTRRSIRKYQDIPIEDDKLKSILRAGMSAPSAYSAEPWRFIVVRDKQRLSALRVFSRYWVFLKDAPAAIVTLGKPDANRSPDFFIQDCSAATQNMLLAAHALGLGGVWLGLYPKNKEMDGVRKVLEIPDEFEPFSIIALGYPIKPKMNKRAYRKEKVFFDKYEK